jgi:hypothetical protein
MKSILRFFSKARCGARAGRRLFRAGAPGDIHRPIDGIARRIDIGIARLRDNASSSGRVPEPSPGPYANARTLRFSNGVPRPPKAIESR